LPVILSEAKDPGIDVIGEQIEMILSQQSAIVTGGGRGIGRAIALALARAGAGVLVFARTAPEVQSVAAEINACWTRGLSCAGDARNPVDVAVAVERAKREFGDVNILINAAGIQGPIGPLWENDFDAWRETLETHLLGTFLFCRAVLPAMLVARRGNIINFSGGGAAAARPFFSAYAASKAGVVRLTETLADEVKDHGVHVNAIAPGAVYTRLTEQVIAAGGAAGAEGLAEALHTQEVRARPDRAAELVLFLLSPESGALTGRLISAVWDDWTAMARDFLELAAAGGYTLRRLDPHGLARAAASPALRSKIRQRTVHGESA
jgi:3-oxoacyl-[acyl-carrier protein] reductase